MQTRQTEFYRVSTEDAQFLGIDFGTYKCVMFSFDLTKREARVILNAEGEESTLSIVYYGDDEILVGTPALDMLEDSEQCNNVISSVKLQIADPMRYPVPGRPTPVQVATEIFRKLKSDAEASGYFTGEITRAVVTYPVVFTQMEQDMLLKAAQDAGFHEVHLLKEPEAAAIAFAHEGYHPGNCILVYDLGAGTFDLALLAKDTQTGFYRCTPLVDGSRHGGDTFDHILYNYCDKLFEDQYGHSLSTTSGTRLKFLKDCRKRKENLSKRPQNTFSWLVIGPGEAVIPFKHTIDVTTFERLIGKVVEETVTRTQAFFERAHASKYTVDTVVLIGGSSQIPLVQRLLQKTLSVEPRRWDHRHRAVALGAALFAYELWGIKNQTEEYRRALEAAQLEGAWNEQTNTRLTDLRRTLELPDRQAERIERELLGFSVSEILKNRQKKTHTSESGEKFIVDEQIQAILDAYKVELKETAQRTFTILLVGRAGVGKSSSINSLMDKEVAKVGHHKPTTLTIEFYHHEAFGIKFTVIDTPGLCDGGGNDETYLERIRTQVPEVDCLWFVTRLNDTRVLADEQRAIKLISAGCGKDIWEHAIIVFTHANSVNYTDITIVPLIDQYRESCKRRPELIRKEIALWAGSSVADKVPSVAIDNLARTTRDGEEWLGKLYVAVLTRIKDRGFLPILLATIERVDFGLQTPENTEDNNESPYTGESRSRIYVADPEPVKKRLIESITSYAAEGAAFGGKIGRDLAGDVGEKVGKALGGAGGGVVGLVKWLFS